MLPIIRLHWSDSAIKDIDDHYENNDDDKDEDV